MIDENGEQLGVMAPFDALKMARERSLDLVEISPNAVPPVCKIQDYGKYLYEKDKSERAARKKQKVITIKEVKFSVTVDEHDYQTKKNQAVRFLGDGDKVKASLRFKGRQMAHRDLGYKIINRLILDIGDAGLVEFMPRMEGTTLHAILAPTKKAEGAPKKVAHRWSCDASPIKSRHFCPRTHRHGLKNLLHPWGCLTMFAQPLTLRFRNPKISVSNRFCGKLGLRTCPVLPSSFGNSVLFSPRPKAQFLASPACSFHA